MNKILLSIALILCISVNCLAQETTLTTATIEPAKSVSAIVEIEGMACQEGCADVISAHLNEVEGVSHAEVSFVDKSAKITFDPTVTSIGNIEKVITDTKVKAYVYTIRKVTLQ
ncbi:MAG: heavy metal-associated domain-containing protein [Maribacter sp.]